MSRDLLKWDLAQSVHSPDPGVALHCIPVLTQLQAHRLAQNRSSHLPDVDGTTGIAGQSHIAMDTVDQELHDAPISVGFMVGIFT